MSNKKQQALLAHCLSSYDYNYIRVDDNTARYEDSWLYYMGQKPYNTEQPSEAQLKSGESISMEYVEPVVRNAVTAITPQVLDIFTEDDQQAVLFRDLSFKPNPIMSEIINKQINRYALHENDGHKVQEGAFKEAAITGDAFTKIYIDEKHEEDTLDLPDWSDMETVIGQLADKQWQCDLPEGIANGEKSGEDGGIQWRTTNAPVQNGVNGVTQRTIELIGKLPIYKVTKKLVLENIGLRDLIIDTNCGDDFSKCRYICHKMTMTVGDAIDLGYKAEALKSASTINRLADAPYNKFNLVTNSQIGVNEQDYEDDGDPLERWITIFEHYIYSSSMDNGKKSRLFQVHTTDSEYLDHQEIKIMPFVHGQIDTIPESFWGRSMYDIFNPYQDYLSKMQRLALKNAFNAAYNKVLVTDKKYDAESVINSNRPGAVIIQRQEGAIQPWPYQELPRSYDVSLQNINQSLNTTMGQMVGNINTEQGVSENMAAQTVSMILAQEQMKSKVIAKTWARTYVRPLFEKIYQVIKENGLTITIPSGTKFESLPQALPQDITITSDQFPDLFDFQIDINTNGDKAVEARQVAAVLQMVTSVQPNSVATAQSIFKVADEQLKIVGRSASEFFTDPSTVKPTDEQILMQQVQKEGALLNLQLIAAQVAKVTSEAGKNEADMGNEAQKTISDIQVRLSESLAKVQKQVSDASVDVVKLNQNQQAIDAEIEQGKRDISIKTAQTLVDAHKTINGVRV